VTSDLPSQQNPFSLPDTAQRALGSGFVWDASGHIVTNNHVVEGASRILVTFAGGSTVEAKLVGADPQSDLAVIKVDPAGLALQPLSLVDSDTIRVGQLAIAIGNPYGLSGTMTEGIVSALSRSLPVSTSTSSTDGIDRGSYTIPDIIQTDAAINPGNSGGVLVDVQGQVIGVTAAIRSSTDSNSGIGFVIPANIVKRVIPVLIDKGSYEHPRLGITATTVTYDLAQSSGLDVNQRGVLVVNVSSGSAAEKAGLKGSTTNNNDSGTAVPSGGDIITAIDGHPVQTFEDLTSYLFTNTEVGQKVTLTILRNGKEMTLDLTLGSLSN
jgi:2-alkenal reductase